MEAAARSTVVAALFRQDSVLEIAVESSTGVHSFIAENSVHGLRIFEQELVALQLREPPFICMCMAPGAHFEGVFFEELRGAPFPRFLMAQPALLAYAQECGLPSDRAETLLRAFRNEYPKASRAV